MTHVLVARMDSQGDVLLMGPAVRAIRERASRVTFLCGPRGRGAAALLPGVDEVVSHVAEWIDAEPPPVDRRRTVALLDDLRRLRPDVAVVMTSFHQSPLPLALLLRLAEVPRIGAISEDYPGSLLDVRHRVDGNVHEVERALSLAAAMGYSLADGDDGRLRVTLRSAPAPHVRPPYVVVHPGAAYAARAWAPERHRELVAELVARGRRVVVTGAPAERSLTAYVAAGTDRAMAIDLGGRTTLAELAHVLRGADAVVVGNTGPAHLAAAVGAPTVSLFAATVPRNRWRPWRVDHVILGRDVPCAGCRARVCPVKGHPCIDDVTPSEVLAALDTVVTRRQSVVAA